MMMMMLYIWSRGEEGWRIFLFYFFRYRMYSRCATIFEKARIFFFSFFDDQPRQVFSFSKLARGGYTPRARSVYTYIYVYKEYKYL